MKTVIENLQDTLEKVRIDLRELLLKHSSIYQWHNNDDAPFILITSGDFAYKPLNDAGKQLQDKIRAEYTYFNELVRSLLRTQSEDVLEQLADADEGLRRTLDQQRTSHTSIEAAFDEASKQLQHQVNLLKNLYDPSPNNAIYVPDTNALLNDPTVENWSFEGVRTFSLYLVPAVLSELDALKINHKNQRVRKKAETLIRKIKEYRRRGSLSDGVVLVRGKSNIFAIAVEPKMKDSLTWLDENNVDDRFVASVIEIMRLHPRSAVTAITLDINLQNKLEFARIPFVEIPDPQVIKK
jgi:hypothetical protein